LVCDFEKFSHNDFIAVIGKSVSITMFGIELLTERLLQLCWILNSVKKETEQYDSIPAN